MTHPDTAHTDSVHAKNWLSELTASLPTQKSLHSTLFIGFLPSKLKLSFEITHILESGAHVTETAQLHWYGTVCASLVYWQAAIHGVCEALQFITKCQ